MESDRVQTVSSDGTTSSAYRHDSGATRTSYAKSHPTTLLEPGSWNRLLPHSHCVTQTGFVSSWILSDSDRARVVFSSVPEFVPLCRACTSHSPLLLFAVFAISLFNNHRIPAYRTRAKQVTLGFAVCMLWASLRF